MRSISLEAIAFDHDPTSASADALSVRRRARTSSCPPEWLREVTRDEHGASVAAYARDQVAGSTVHIKARLRYESDEDFNSHTWMAPQVRIRTLDSAAARGCLTAVFDAFTGDTTPPPAPGVLGTVAPTETLLLLGGNHEVLLPLTGTRFDVVGVGTHDIGWIWQYQWVGESTWHTFATTKHRIFTVLDEPTAPWGQPANLAADRSLPWVSALGVACRWASGAQTLDEAAGAITRQLYNDGAFTYDAAGGGSARYAFGDLDLTGALDRLSGGVGNGPYVNCSDCAALVSTLSNLLGHRLGQGRFDWGVGNGSLRLIGDPSWGLSSPFDWHEVAWQGTNQRSDRVWDACAELDMDAAPNVAPHLADNPTGIPHSEPFLNSYVWRVTTPVVLIGGDYPPDPTPAIVRPVY